MTEAVLQIKDALKMVAVGVDERELTDDVLLADLGIDSIKYVELLVLIEEKLNIAFSESDLALDGLRSIGELHQLIDKTVAGQAG